MGVLKAKVGPDRDGTKLRPAAFTTVTLSAALLTTKTSPSATASPVGSSKPKEGPEAVPTKAPLRMANSVSDPAPLRTKRSGPDEASATGSSKA